MPVLSPDLSVDLGLYSTPNVTLWKISSEAVWDS